VSRLQRLQRLWLWRLRRLRRLLSVLVVRRLLAGLMPWKGMIEAWRKRATRQAVFRARTPESDGSSRFHRAGERTSDFCNTADLDRAEIWHDGGASGPHNREALGEWRSGLIAMRVEVRGGTS
jgi:hypothetical protein